MCGIAGVLGSHPLWLPDVMGDCVDHRGPDARASMSEGPVGLSHRRLEVVGLGDGGAQPMESMGRRYLIAYNGEVYNHMAIRHELEARGLSPQWRGSSDTETFLAAIEAWGLATTLQKVVGMFAFALWDRHHQRLTLVRDRMGEKPLYWAWHGDRLLFGSQPSALLKSPGFDPEVDVSSLAEFLRYGYVPGVSTIRTGIRELEPGTLLAVRPGERGARPQTWWSLDQVAREALDDPLHGDDATVIDALEEAITESVRIQSTADVPLGAFLSGGIDSSLIVATMQRIATSQTRTFSLGFTDPAFNEAPFAREIARHLGTDHTEVIIDAAEAQAVIPDLPRIYDEPFADSSQIPTTLISRIARQHVTVVLTGDGGDELFGGYRRYWKLERDVRNARRLARQRLLRLRLPGRHSRVESAQRFLSVANHDPGLVRSVDQRRSVADFERRWRRTAGLGTSVHRSMALDQVGYLPDDILHKVDRAAMSVALETRIPLLDHRVVSLAWRLVAAKRCDEAPGKRALRQLLSRSVPEALFERPKSGFGVPIDDWLRGPLRVWADELLAQDLLREDGLLDGVRVRESWDAHLAGTQSQGSKLWPVLMFQAWRNAR